MAVHPEADEAQDRDLKEHLKELVTDLTQQTTTLVRQEIELLKAEVGQKTDLLKDELQNASTQARQEIELAKAQMTDAAKQAGVGAGLAGAGGFLGFGAFGTFTAFLVAVLATFMPVWLSALAVTVVYGAIAGVLLLAARNKVQDVDLPVPRTMNRLKALFSSTKTRVQTEISPVPEQTVSSLKAAKDDLSQAWQRGGQGGKR